MIMDIFLFIVNTYIYFFVSKIHIATKVQGIVNLW